MAAPLAEGEGATEIISEGLISQPYVRMTIKLMKQFCVEVRQRFHQKYDEVSAS